MDYKEWCPDEAIQDLTVRRALREVEDPVKMAVDLLKENLPLSVLSMTHLAVHSPTEAIRYQASKYIMDRTLGDPRANLMLPDNKPAWERIYDDVLVEAEKIVNE